MGADVLLVDRPVRSAAGLRSRALVRRDAARPAIGDAGSQVGAGRRRRACARRARGRADRRLPAGRARATGARAGRAARTQPEARRRTRDRLGPAGSAGRTRGSRHQLHRAVRCAACDRSRGRHAGAAVEPRRRLRRRRHAARVRHRLRAARGAALGSRAGRRRGDDRRRVAADDDVLGHGRGEPMERAARRQRARWRRAVVRDLRDAGRQARRDRRDRAEVLRRAAATSRARGRSAACAARPRGWPALRDRFAQRVPRSHARRMGSRVRGLRCLLRAGADVLRGGSGIRTTLARRGHAEVGGIVQPAPAPATVADAGRACRGAPPERGGEAALRAARLGLHATEIARIDSRFARDRVTRDPRCDTERDSVVAMEFAFHSCSTAE